MYAVQFGYIEALKILEMNGADIKETNIQGDSLIHMSAKINRPDIVSWLLDKGLSPFLKN